MEPANGSIFYLFSHIDKFSVEFDKCNLF